MIQKDPGVSLAHYEHAVIIIEFLGRRCAALQRVINGETVSSVCPYCFMDTPHAAEYHDELARHLEGSGSTGTEAYLRQQAVVLRQHGQHGKSAALAPSGDAQPAADGKETA